VSVLSNAVRQEQWELAALCLLLGMEKTLEKIPPDSLEGMMEMLEANSAPESPNASQ